MSSLRAANQDEIDAAPHALARHQPAKCDFFAPLGTQNILSVGVPCFPALWAVCKKNNRSHTSTENDDGSYFGIWLTWDIVSSAWLCRYGSFETKTNAFKNQGPMGIDAEVVGRTGGWAKGCLDANDMACYQWREKSMPEWLGGWVDKCMGGRKEWKNR